MNAETKTLASEYEHHPRKPAGIDRPPGVGSTHKQRSYWFQARQSWPLREAPVELLVRERGRAAVELPSAEGSGQWTDVGPSNIGGRMTTAVCDPADPDQVWAGAAGGGVWHSTDAGKSWQALWHREGSLNIGALAVDPRSPQTLYCGTGEANLSADSYPGVGVFRSLDAGHSWQILATTQVTGLPKRIGALAVDPFDSNHLMAGGVGHLASDASGLYSSLDGGMVWARIPFLGTSFYRCHDVRFHPTNAAVIFATISALGMQNGIWRSEDGGVNWVHLGGGLPSPDLIGRTSLALAPSDPDVVYAQLSRQGAVLGVFRSDDGGDSWTSISGSHFADERQMSYGNSIVVHPENVDWVLCGGVDLHQTKNAGATWTKVTRWDAERGTPGYAHADHHCLFMPAARPGWVFDLNDGGMDFSENGGDTWTNRSNGLATNMFYDLAVAQTDSNMIAGGAQDNGTLVTLDGQPSTYIELTGGDGGWAIIDPMDAGHLFTTAQGMRIFRFRSSDGWRDVSPREDMFDMWMVLLSLDVGHRATVFTGSRRVWRTTDDGDSWQAVSDNLDDSSITALEVARADGRRVYVGTENGGIFRSTDGGASWSDNVASTVLPGRTITHLESRPDNVDVLYATVANFGSAHVFRSPDGGLSWVALGGTTLPDAPFHSVTVPAAHPARVYTCGDAGVFVSEDEGVSWVNLTGNLPSVQVVDLVYSEADRALTVATYGRSCWRLQVD